ncbi:MAG: hypothetical protein V4576_03255 [Patescibacteria group bacterium]
MNKKILVSLIGLAVVGTLLSPLGFSFFANLTAGERIDEFGDRIAPEIIFGLTPGRMAQYQLVGLTAAVFGAHLLERKKKV